MDKESQFSGTSDLGEDLLSNQITSGRYMDHARTRALKGWRKVANIYYRWDHKLKISAGLQTIEDMEEATVNKLHTSQWHWDRFIT